MALKSDAGYAVWMDPGADAPLLELATVQCCHCGAHFPAPRFGSSELDKQSRIGRGWCFRCGDYICGAGCQECVPVEQYLSNIENGRPENYVPINVSFAGLVGEKAGDIWTPSSE